MTMTHTPEPFGLDTTLVTANCSCRGSSAFSACNYEFSSGPHSSAKSRGERSALATAQQPSPHIRRREGFSSPFPMPLNLIQAEHGCAE